MEQRRQSDRWLCRIAIIWDFIEKRQVVRRLSAVWVMILTTLVLQGTVEFGWNSTRPGLEVAAIIAAIWTPLSALQGFIFKFYNEVEHAPIVVNQSYSNPSPSGGDSIRG